jgi:hypothetical protein
MDDPVLPEIGSVFILTKKDSTDFDRNVVSRRLGIIPTKTCPPTVSPGKLLSEIDPAEFQREYSGLTVLPAAAPPYTIIKNAFWCLELPRMHSWDVADPLHRLEELLKGREEEVTLLCKEYDLTAELILRVYAESNDLPVVALPSESVSFWSKMGAGIQLDLYLD